MSFPSDSLLAVTFLHPQNFNPGGRHEYCNTDIAIPGLSIEKVAGKPANQPICEKNEYFVQNNCGCSTAKESRVSG